MIFAFPPLVRACRTAAACASLAVAATVASAQNAQLVPARVEARFTCADGKAIDATFINTGNSRVQLDFSDGRKMTLPHVMSASGARYANEAGTIVFWNKGNTAFVQESGQTTYSDCVTKR